MRSQDTMALGKTIDTLHRLIADPGKQPGSGQDLGLDLRQRGQHSQPHGVCLHHGRARFGTEYCRIRLR